MQIQLKCQKKYQLLVYWYMSDTMSYHTYNVLLSCQQGLVLTLLCSPLFFQHFEKIPQKQVEKLFKPRYHYIKKIVNFLSTRLSLGVICRNKSHTMLRSISTSWFFSKNYFVDLLTNNFLRVILAKNQSFKLEICALKSVCDEQSLLSLIACLKGIEFLMWLG